jgi:[ribosomal protein S5]-alanine N-acetyltransferase
MVLSNQVEINTPRLLLKGITPEFVEEIFAGSTREEIMSYFGVDKAGYDHLHNMHQKGMVTFRLSFFHFLMVEKDRNVPIGECGFHTWNDTHKRAELFYSLRKDEHKQKGYMTEALKETLTYGFTTMGLHRVAALAGIGNKPSIKLLSNFGFTWEGTMREDYVVNGRSENSECYSLLKQEWIKWSLLQDPHNNQ